MNICPREFDGPDPDDPTYSMLEVDYYSWIPPRFQQRIPNHRLSLRKNLVTGHYEVYRQYQDTEVARGYLAGQPFLVVTHKESGLEEVAKDTVKIEEAIDFANHEVEVFHGERGTDRVCDGVHFPAFGCHFEDCELRRR